MDRAFGYRGNSSGVRKFRRHVSAATPPRLRQAEPLGSATFCSGLNRSARPVPLFFFITFLLIAVPRDGCSVGALVNDEGRALLMFRDALTTDPFGAFTNWNINDPNPCLWNGVYCDQELNVMRLILEGKQLEGMVSKELSRLTHLRTLNLAGNNISGAVPPEFGQLSTLYKLNISNNALTGELPSQLDYLNRLRMVDLSGNMLTGALPAGIFGSNCSKLRYINLAGNGFTGSIPDTVGLCWSLEGINLASNFLRGSIPSTIGRLRALRYAHLGDNLLAGSLPSELGFCLSLEQLDVSKNHLEGDFPITMSNLKNLQYLDASQNSLSGNIIPDVVFQPSIRYVNLSRNELSGELPVFNYGNCTTMATYDLSFNNLGGNLPQDFGLCMSAPASDNPAGATLGTLQAPVLELDLSGNNFTGILQVVATFPNIQTLDISDNRLSGMLPDPISQWHAIRALDFSNNLFQGMIPEVWTGLANLVDFNVSFNELTGPIPRRGIFLSLGASSFLGNEDLCGSPLATSCPNTPPLPDPPAKTRVLSASAIIAISVAGFVAFFVILVTVMSIKIRRRADKTELLVYESSPPSPEGRSAILGKLVLFGKHLPDYYEDFETGSKRILDNDCVIGSGSIGTVYKASFEGGKAIAVKKLSTLGRLKNQEEFEQEMGMLGDLRHPNLVLLHGYYWSSSMQLLLSDYIANGNLHQHLHEIAHEFHVDWPRRLYIALGTARALAFLHHECKPPVLHFDVKSSNILLDENFEPYLADYGLTKILPLMDVYVTSRKFQSALGYVAPELACQSLRLTEKCDVYSFGVVLLELATSQLPVLQQDGEEVVILCDLVRAANEKGRVARCLDAGLMTGDPESVAAEMLAVLKLGLDCTAQLPARRPSMMEVVQILEAIHAGAISPRAISN